MKKLCLFLIAHLVAMEEPTREVSVYSVDGHLTVIELPETITLAPCQMPSPEIREVIRQLAGDDVKTDYIGTTDPDRIDRVRNGELFLVEKICPVDPVKDSSRYIVVANEWLRVVINFLDPVRLCFSGSIGYRFSDFGVSFHSIKTIHFKAKFIDKSNHTQVTICFLQKGHNQVIHDTFEIIHESMLGFRNKLDVEGISGPLIEQEWEKILFEYFKTQSTLISIEGGFLYQIEILSPNRTYETVIVNFNNVAFIDSD